MLKISMLVLVGITATTSLANAQSYQQYNPTTRQYYNPQDPYSNNGQLQYNPTTQQYYNQQQPNQHCQRDGVGQLYCN